MRQTRKEVQGVYVAWMLGASIEYLVGPVDDMWRDHRMYTNIHEADLPDFYIWMIANDKIDSENSAHQCELLMFRVKQETPNAD